MNSSNTGDNEESKILHGSPAVDLTSVVDDLDAIVKALNGRPAILKELEETMTGHGSAVLMLL